MTYVVGVDIRSSKICELGLLNYKAKHVFYPSEERRFRCRDDYYWASIFQVIIAFYTWLSSLWVTILYVKFRKDHGFSWFHIVNHMWLGLTEISRTLLDSYIVRLSMVQKLKHTYAQHVEFFKTRFNVSYWGNVI